jgi:hypothetical protein
MEEEPRMKSTVTGGGRSQKGRGFKDGAEPERYPGGKFESLEAGTGPGPAKCAPARPRGSRRAHGQLHTARAGESVATRSAWRRQFHTAAPHAKGAIRCGR